MTRNEARIVRAATKVMRALERVARWNGTGGTQQQRAWDARDKAVLEWNALLEELGHSAKAEEAA